MVDEHRSVRPKGHNMPALSKSALLRLCDAERPRSSVALLLSTDISLFRVNDPILEYIYATLGWLLRNSVG